MKRLFQLLILINTMASILAVCPDRPTIPTSSITEGLLITPTSEGMSNFPTSTTHLSVTMAVKIDQECTAGSIYNLLTIGLTPPGSPSQEYLTVSASCDPPQMIWGGDWYNSTLPTAFPSGFTRVAFFLTFDLDAKKIKFQYQTESKSASTIPRYLTMVDGMSFDQNTKFYLCSDKLGASPNACTISEFVLEYRTYGVNRAEYAHLGAKDPSYAAFYPLTDGPATSLKSYTNSEIQAAPGYFGDDPINPTPGTSPAWDSSNAFVTITKGQFLTFPLPSIASHQLTIPYSFAVAAWVRIRDVQPSPSVNTLISTHLANGTLSGFSVTTTGDIATVSISFNTLLVGTGERNPTIARDTWQLIGFTASVRTDTKYLEGSVFSGSSSRIFYQFGNTPTFDYSALSFIRIGGETNSFGGDISLVRIMTPGGGVVRYTDLCSTLSSFELGVADFALSCSGNNMLSSADGQCYASCPSGTRSVTTETASLCPSCPLRCAECNSIQCLACYVNYLLYQGACIDSCPDKMYSAGSTCENCPAHCKECNSLQCLTCETGYLSYQGSCLDSCPEKTYSTGSICKDCPTSCQACNSAQCLACDTNYLIYKESCLRSCPDKTYSTGSACQDCPAHCKECNSLQCLSCETDHFFYQDECVDSCPDKMYYTGSVCENCPVRCKACEITGCLTCETNYFFYQGDCLESCPAKTYVHQNSCIACSNHCIECNIDGCKACDDGYQVDDDKRCVLPSSSSQSSSPSQVEAGISGGAIAGIACGGIALTTVAGWVFYAVKFKKSLFFLQRSSTGFTSINSNPPSPTKIPTTTRTFETETGPMIA